jgi:guanosine-3',5'-bis(diphosphate) 3'-pyrophosphohydrolase
MNQEVERTVRPLVEAVSFAARAHEGQVRKDGRTPYVSHVFRVCLTLRHVFGIDDPQVLAAAALHDTIEDSTTDFDDLQEQFGTEVAEWVAALSKDKRMPEQDREQAYIKGLVKSPWQVKVCKLADIFDNVIDSITVPREQRGRVFKRSHSYLDALKADLPVVARGPWEIVAQLLAEMEAKQ